MDGVLSIVGVSDRYPDALWPVTVRVPVTAMADEGTLVELTPGVRPVTWRLTPVPAVSLAERPFLTRVSRMRLGVRVR